VVAKRQKNTIRRLQNVKGFKVRSWIIILAWKSSGHSTKGAGLRFRQSKLKYCGNMSSEE
jgi:hypothetical protein